jgi:hypothetical protein
VTLLDHAVSSVAMKVRGAWLLGFLAVGCVEDSPRSWPDGGDADGGDAGAGDGSAIGACPTVDETGLTAPLPGPTQDGGASGDFVDPAPAKAIDSDDGYSNRTERFFLSGRGIDDAVSWRFLVTGGRNACKWSTLPVPSHWEFHGFGTFRYGSETRTNEQGIYRRTFELPADWGGKRVGLVFEGSMTDTTVTVNGRIAGPTHRGAFYRFRYDVTDLVVPGASNQIEVTVAKESSDPSVNEAERQADYWVFGGIFRPVYLEAYPAQSIERFAVNAKADGTLSADVFLRGITGDAELSARVLDDSLAPVGAPLTTTVAAGRTQVTLQGSFAGIKPWTAETPNRYRLAVDLATAAGTTHAHRENFGFRTVEVRAGDGIYVNGSKVRLRGLNRHAFWPESGRALSRRLNWADAALLKSMNNNAVRCSHYPADRAFYEAADTLGLYVLDELAGWQAPPYDTEVGRPLIEEMVTFNVNHPSIIFWDNGNEGGWNAALDGEFAKWDPQKRAVLHPWAIWSNVDTDHYETYASTVNKLAAARIYLPTEFLHGLYDGGGGAGLEDYWTATKASRVGAGGFLWAFVDEGVFRADEAGRIDVKGNAAPDGVVGPYRQKEGSFHAIRQIWSPVQIALKKLPADFSGAIPVGNDYDHINLDTVSFKSRLARFDSADADGGHTVVGEWTSRTASIPPGGAGTLQLPLPANWRTTADAILLTATDGAGTEIGQWSWMIAPAAATRASVVASTNVGVAVATDDADSVTVSAAGIRYTFSKTSGQLAGVDQGATAVALRGPMLSVGTATLQSMAGVQEGNDYVITTVFTGSLQQMLWRVHGNGWLALTYRYALAGSYDYFGVDFDYPEARVQSVDWLGRGPYRVWKNRMAGPWHDVWHREKNNAVPGQRWEYPEFKGYFADVRWARLHTTEGPITFVLDTDDIFMRLYTPANGASPQTAVAVFPAHDISFLHGIAPIGDKFLAPSALGPQAAQHMLDGTFEATIFIRPCCEKGNPLSE